LDKLWQKLKKNLRLKGALMRAIEFFAKTAFKTHFRTLFWMPLIYSSAFERIWSKAPVFDQRRSEALTGA
jgi:hypothetical protein